MGIFKNLVGMVYEEAEELCMLNNLILLFEAKAMSPYYWNDSIYTIHDNNGTVGRLKVEKNKVVWATPRRW